MASLYEIDQAILACIDAETGEIVDVEQLEALQLEREEKIENVALWYKNLVADAKAYGAEKAAFAEREKAAKTKAESLKRWLDEALAGNPYKSARVAVSYRKSERVIVDDIHSLHTRFLKFSEPEPDKTAIKAAIKEGEEIIGAHIETCSNMTIK